MRQIKFRAWEKKGKGFIAGFNMIGFGVGAGIPFSLQRFDSKWKLEDVELEQFTGLLDKNGKEIYEGDIVKDHCKEVGGRFLRADIVKISWIEGCFNCESKTRAAYLREMGPNLFLEVIGNIHENPELLKASK